jgi:2-methylcitrate dehydratase PrpD
VITEEVSNFVCSLNLDQVPGDVQAIAKRHILDTLGVIIAGIREEAAHIAIKHAALMGGGGHSAPPLQAFIYGLLGHVLDYDDTQLATRPAGVYGLCRSSAPPWPAPASARPAARSC